MGRNDELDTGQNQQLDMRRWRHVTWHVWATCERYLAMKWSSGYWGKMFPWDGAWVECVVNFCGTWVVRDGEGRLKRLSCFRGLVMCVDSAIAS